MEEENNTREEIAVIKTKLEYIEQTTSKMDQKFDLLPKLYEQMVEIRTSQKNLAEMFKGYVKQEEFLPLKGKVDMIWRGIIGVLTLVFFTVIAALLSLVVKK